MFILQNLRGIEEPDSKQLAPFSIKLAGGPPGQPWQQLVLVTPQIRLLPNLPAASLELLPEELLGAAL